ncbi:MAG: 50S ribosomal protein L3 N(5)-glutamine methyltransferase [Betaproteobacteria bacterium]|nr:50S ribosomal protein L3 N(5)-glutamine methyltransferase [Betaproteobacteria bacterium]
MFAEAADQLHTVRDLLRFAVSRFREAGLVFGHGTTDAYDEAAYLVLHTLHLPIDRLEPFLDSRLLHREVSQVLSVIERRVVERKPSSYLTGEAWLNGCRFTVNEDVLIPRSHIAGLLDDALGQWIPEPQSVRRALDLCTGSGCLAILLAQTFPEAQVDAIDCSAKALAVARINVGEYRLHDRVRLVESDLFQAVPDARYDLIISNPPYVTTKAMAALPPEYRHEPSLGLAAGDDGLDIVRRILHEAPRHLTPKGVLLVEVGGEKAAVEAAYPKLPFLWFATDTGEEEVFLLNAKDLPLA